MKTRIVKSLPILAAVLLLAAGCNYFKKSQFDGKTFKIKTELKQAPALKSWSGQTQINSNATRKDTATISM